MTTYYTGSDFLLPVTHFVGLSLDKVNFIAAELLCLPLGFLFRRLCNIEQIGRSWRLLAALVPGLLLLWFCNGGQILHLFVQSSVVWILLKCLPTPVASHLVFIWSMVYLAANHIYRQIYDYGGYTLDITGPLMIQTQKLTSLGFALADGQLMRKGFTVKGHRSRHYVLDHPSLLEFLGYLYYFHGCMAGPLSFYTDYIAFIDEAVHPGGSPTQAMYHCLLHATIFGPVNVFGSVLLPYGYVVSEAFTQLTWWRRLLYVCCTSFVGRCKYYFAWSLAEAANLSAGFGYSGPAGGTSGHSRQHWNLLRNFDLKSVETGTSLKVVVDGWNIPTAVWLRETVYERAPDKYKTLLVFLCSAFWHGFYPGYYCFFVTFAIFTFAARRVRRVIRPHFQQNLYLLRPAVYDVITGITASLAMNYAMGSFFLLEMGLTLRYWSAMFFYGHILAGVVLFCIPLHGQPVKLVQQLVVPAAGRMRLAAEHYMPNMPDVGHHLQQYLETVLRGGLLGNADRDDQQEAVVAAAAAAAELAERSKKDV